MGLFSRATKKEVKNPPAGGAAPKTVVSSVPAKARTTEDDGAHANVLRAPWFSEKALILTEKSVYAFLIPQDATKHDVARAIEKIYKVKPRKVHVVNLPGKRISLRNRRGTGTRAARRRAYVYLKKGETIQFA